jgi:folate-binding protein YgfZ
MTVSIAVLSERAVLAVEGAEVRDFLHSLLTCDLLPLETGEAAYGALLTPQGKILFDLFAVATERGFLLDGAASAADDLLKRLMMYRLRRKIEIARRPELAIAAIWDDCQSSARSRESGNPGSAGEPPDLLGPRLRGDERVWDLEDAIVFRDPRAEGLGYRAIAPLATLQTAANTDPGHYHAHRVRLGIPDSDRDIGTGALFPHEADLDQLHGVSFTKGCFVGQEVVSRMEHRGTARSRIVPVRFAAAVPSGTEIAAGGRSLGTVLSTADGRGLALMRLDRAEAALSNGDALMAGETPVAIEKPAWARFALPGAEGA